MTFTLQVTRFAKAIARQVRSTLHVTRYALSVMQKNQKGLSLVEVLVSVLIIALLTLGVYSLLVLSLKITADNKFYLEAMEIANQKMEQIRNLSYADVGTVSGSPSGAIPDSETISREGEYTISTFIKYEDDEYDGTLDLGTDDIHDDYKIATVKVSWQGKYGEKSVTVFSKIIPNTEETSTGNGLLKIIVVDSNGNPVDDADIHIENATHSISATSTSDSDGEFKYSVLPDFEGYEITVTKSGYGIDKTYTRDEIINGIINSNPTKPHLTVTEGVKTEESFSIDLLSNLTIKTVTANLPQNWQVNNDTSGEAQVNSRLAIDNAGFIYIVWQDYRDTSSDKPRIYAQKYDADGNAQWPNSTTPNDIKISDANNQVLPDILVDNDGNLYICWNDDSNGNQDAYLMKRASADGSDLWSGAKKVDTAADNKDQITARIALLQASGGNATTSIVWADDRNTDIDLYMQLYDIDRNEQLTPEIRVNSNAVSDGTDQYDPEIIADSADDIYVVWADNRNVNLDIYAAKFDDNGNNLWADKLINTDAGATDQYAPDIAVDSNDNIYIVWADERNGNKDVYAQKYDLTGAALWAADKLINTDAGATDQYSPAIAIDSNDIIYIVWTDERNDNQDIYAQKYDVDGNNSWTEDVRVNIDTGSSAQYNPDVTIDTTTNPDTPYVTWQSDINGDFDIFASSFGEYTNITNISNVDITVTGTKRIGEDPIIYEYDEEHTTDTNGNVSLNLEWDVHGYTITPTSTPYTLVLSDPTQPLELLAAETKKIWLYLE